MKKLLIILLGLAIVGALSYLAVGLKPRPEEISTQSTQEMADDLALPELENFDQDINTLDQSINQL